MGSAERFIPHKGEIEAGTLPNSFEAVLKNYEGAMECDLVLLADGEIAIVHPRDIGGSAAGIEQMGLSDIEAQRIPSDDPDREHGRAIPLMHELVGFASDTDTRLVMDLKASNKEKAFVLVEKIIERLGKMRKDGAFKLNP